MACAASACGVDPVVPPGCALSESDAREAAARVLALGGFEWGEPIRIDFASLLFTLTYETPDEEAELLGLRQVTVECLSGEARLVPRL